MLLIFKNRKFVNLNRGGNMSKNIKKVSSNHSQVKKEVSKKSNIPPDTTNRQSEFEHHISKFVAEIESLSRATNMTMSTVLDAMKKHSEEFLKFIDKRGIKTSEKEDGKSFIIKPNDVYSFKIHMKDVSTATLAFKNVPRIFFCSLVHQYDAYLGNILRECFRVRPETMHVSQKHMTFSDLLKYQSIEAAQEFLIEKEVESIIRESHAVQFDWMEKRFDLTLRKDLPAWPQFIELTERRNLFVHCDGIVSSQYLDMCKQHGFVHKKNLKVGDQLTVSTEYFKQAIDCIIEIGVKLGHVLWRKLEPKELEKADNALHLITYEFLSDEWYSLTKILLHFAEETLIKKSSDNIRRMNLINLAIAYKFTGDTDKACKLLDTQDWSACEDKFKLAVAVLHDRKDETIRIMKRIGKDGSVRRQDYSSWPLFKEFRTTKEFLGTYKELFGEEFILFESEIKEPLQRIAESQH